MEELRNAGKSGQQPTTLPRPRDAPFAAKHGILLVTPRFRNELPLPRRGESFNSDSEHLY
jgi:hypothetical protein